MVLVYRPEYNIFPVPNLGQIQVFVSATIQLKPAVGGLVWADEVSARNSWELLLAFCSEITAHKKEGGTVNVVPWLSDPWEHWHREQC